MFSLDFFYIFSWWLMFLSIGIVSFPIAHFFFSKFSDAGYAFSKTIGFLIASYALFVLSIFKVVPFTQTTTYLFLLFVSVISAWIYFKKSKEIANAVRKKIVYIVISEALFSFGLFFWSYIRSFQPDIYGLEKFMDFGFVNTILRTKYLPPIDMWFADKPINYYWFGHYYTAFITRTSQTPNYIAYNLMLASIMGFLLSGVFSIISTLAKTAVKKARKRKSIVAGIVSAVLVTFAGNFHTPIYYYINGYDKYWYPDATRFIGYNPDVPDKTIHEFPIYSFVVSDLHAHLINLTFVVLFIALLALFFLNHKGKFSINKTTVSLSFLLGIMFMTSTWDFANYSLLLSFSFLVLFLRKGKFTISNIFKVAIPFAQIIVFSFIFSLPFILNFESIAYFDFRCDNV